MLLVLNFGVMIDKLNEDLFQTKFSQRATTALTDNCAQFIEQPPTAMKWN
jgi:hypothetical protein